MLRKSQLRVPDRLARRVHGLDQLPLHDERLTQVEVDLGAGERDPRRRGLSITRRKVCLRKERQAVTDRLRRFTRTATVERTQAEVAKKARDGDLRRLRLKHESGAERGLCTIHVPSEQRGEGLLALARARRERLEVGVNFSRGCVGRHVLRCALRQPQRLDRLQ